MLIRRANGDVVAIDGRETAPAGASRDMFLRNGKVKPELCQTGALASGVPGSLAAYEFALNHYGRKKLKELILPAADIAQKGFPVETVYALCLKSVEHELAGFDSTRKVFFRGGHPLGKGDVLKQPDLAFTYRQIAEHGVDWFYRGPFAEAVAKWMQENGGLLTARDFKNFEIKLREPIVSTYRGFTLVGFPPPSSGGIHVAEILNILENFDLKSLDEATRLHVIAQAMKLAFADRAYWLGDPDFVDVPRGLADKVYASSLAKSISKEHVTAVPSHGMPPNAQTDLFKKHTTHFSVADAEGKKKACTATVNTSFG